MIYILTYTLSYCLYKVDKKTMFDSLELILLTIDEAVREDSNTESTLPWTNIANWMSV